MTRKLSEETIQKIREDTIEGKSKYKIARDYGISANVVYNYTKDIPTPRKEPCIRGRALELLKEILRKGYVYTEKNGTPLRFLTENVIIINMKSSFTVWTLYI